MWTLTGTLGDVWTLTGTPGGCVDFTSPPPPPLLPLPLLPHCGRLERRGEGSGGLRLPGGPDACRARHAACRVDPPPGPRQASWDVVGGPALRLHALHLHALLLHALHLHLTPCTSTSTEYYALHLHLHRILRPAPPPPPPPHVTVTVADRPPPRSRVPWGGADSAPQRQRPHGARQHRVPAS